MIVEQVTDFSFEYDDNGKPNLVFENPLNNEFETKFNMKYLTDFLDLRTNIVSYSINDEDNCLEYEEVRNIPFKVSMEFSNLDDPIKGGYDEISLPETERIVINKLHIAQNGDCFVDILRENFYPELDEEYIREQNLGCIGHLINQWIDYSNESAERVFLKTNIYDLSVEELNNLDDYENQIEQLKQKSADMHP